MASDGLKATRNSSHSTCHTSAYVSIRQHTSQHLAVARDIERLKSAGISEHASAYVSIREHTSLHLAVARDIERLKYSDDVRLL